MRDFLATRISWVYRQDGYTGVPPCLASLIGKIWEKPWSTKIARGKTLVPVKHPFKKTWKIPWNRNNLNIGGNPQASAECFGWSTSPNLFVFPTKTYSDLKLNCQSLLSHNIIITFKGCYEKNYYLDLFGWSNWSNCACSMVLFPWFSRSEPSSPYLRRRRRIVTPPCFSRRSSTSRTFWPSPVPSWYYPLVN